MKCRAVSSARGSSSSVLVSALMMPLTESSCVWTHRTGCPADLVQGGDGDVHRDSAVPACGFQLPLEGWQ